jgi:phosphoribosylformylglycinamidine synthase
VLGVLGLLEDAGAAVGSRFRDDGDVVVALGAPTVEGLAGSEFQRVHDDALGGVLAAVDLDLEVRLAATLADLAGASLLRSAHDVSTGGLLGCLADQVAPGLGVTLDAPLGDVDDVQRLFSESPGRVLVTCAAADVDDVVAAAAERDVPAAPVGRVGGDRVAVHGVVDLALAEVLDAVHGAVPRVLGEA